MTRSTQELSCPRCADSICEDSLHLDGLQTFGISTPVDSTLFLIADLPFRMPRIAHCQTRAKLSFHLDDNDKTHLLFHCTQIILS